jgi:uncharacterized membrane protein
MRVFTRERFIRLSVAMVATLVVVAAASLAWLGLLPVQFTTPHHQLIYLALTLMAVVTVVATLTSLYLYRWRTILMRDGRCPSSEQLGLLKA